MLTSFFGKSNPINYFLVSAFIILGYGFYLFQKPGESLQLQYFIQIALLILLSIFLILLLDFIIRKNKLTAINTYAIYIFACMLLMIPHHISGGHIALANLFLLLAFRRILSIQSDKNLNKKILDSAIWIAVASLFYFWSILHLIVLFTAIGLKKSNKNYRYFLIPIAGMLTVLIIVSALNVFYDREVFWFLYLNTSHSFNLNDYDNNRLLVLVFFMAIAALWAILGSISKYTKLAKKNKPNHVLLVLMLFIGLVISFSAIDKNGTEFFFLFFPLSVQLTKSIETIQLRWLKELILWGITITPVILFMMN